MSTRSSAMSLHQTIPQVPSSCSLAGRGGIGRGHAGLGALALAALLGACAAPGEMHLRAASPVSGRSSVSLITPRCVGVQSCLLGRVTAAESALPLARAAVFLERLGEDAGGTRIQTLTDEDGVFIVVDPPPGSYRLAIYKEARKVEMSGVTLGAAGTTMVPVRMALR